MTTLTTTTLHRDVARSRFAHHVLAAIGGFFAVGAPARAATATALEAQRVRELAQSYTKTDPGFASDLFAAAARHEGLNGE